VAQMVPFDFSLTRFINTFPFVETEKEIIIIIPYPEKKIQLRISTMRMVTMPTSKMIKMKKMMTVKMRKSQMKKKIKMKKMRILQQV